VFIHAPSHVNSTRSVSRHGRHATLVLLEADSASTPVVLCGSGQQHPLRAPQRVQRIAFEIVSSGVGWHRTGGDFVRSHGLSVRAMTSVMDRNTTALERAFQLAKSGNVATIDALKRQLRAEGYSAATITGTTLAKQLRALIQASQRPEAPADATGTVPSS
jgi:hypothetical protein